jgi:hypothetical protein
VNGARFARCLVRFLFNIGGVAGIFALTASTFDARGMMAVLFLALWFGIVEAATAFAKVAPPRMQRQGSAHLALAATVAVLALSVVPLREREATRDTVTVAAVELPTPNADAAIARLSARYTSAGT